MRAFRYSDFRPHPHSEFLKLVTETFDFVRGQVVRFAARCGMRCKARSTAMSKDIASI
jgi:hypothetical protein